MSNYRRLISYIYAYEGGVKGKNIGFAKIETKGIQCKITVSVKRIYVGGNDIGAYLLAGDQEIFLGNIFIRGGSGEFRTAVSVNNIESSGICMDECYGLTIHDVKSTWRSYTTIWEDAVAHAAEVDLKNTASASQVKDQAADSEEQIKKAVREIEEEFPLKPETSSEKPAEDEEKLALTEPEQSEPENLHTEIMESEPEETGFTAPENAESDSGETDDTEPDTPDLEEIEPKEEDSKEPVEMEQRNIQQETLVSEPEELPIIQQAKLKQEEQKILHQQEPKPEHQDTQQAEAKPEDSRQNRYIFGEPYAPYSRQEVKGNTVCYRAAAAMNDSSKKEIRPILGNPDELERLSQDEIQDENSHELIWEKLKREHTRILAFDYENGCEILTIKPQDIGLLPREAWVFGNNSFLLHGYYNFHYLILARLFNPQGIPRYLLGVPGHYYSNERYLASMLGFPNFVLSKEQPMKDGRFGYWYTDVKMGG